MMPAYLGYGYASKSTSINLITTDIPGNSIDWTSNLTFTIITDFSGATLRYNVSLQVNPSPTDIPAAG